MHATPARLTSRQSISPKMGAPTLLSTSLPRFHSAYGQKKKAIQSCTPTCSRREPAEHLYSIRQPRESSFARELEYNSLGKSPTGRLPNHCTVKVTGIACTTYGDKLYPTT